VISSGPGRDGGEELVSGVRRPDAGLVADLSHLLEGPAGAVGARRICCGMVGVSCTEFKRRTSSLASGPAQVWGFSGLFRGLINFCVCCSMQDGSAHVAWILRFRGRGVGRSARASIGSCVGQHLRSLISGQSGVINP
jgi:hypothetical protein